MAFDPDKYLNEFNPDAYLEITTPAVEVTEKAPTQAEKDAFEAEQAGLGERMFGMGSPTYSFIRGAVIEPALGLNKLLADTGLFGETVKQGAANVARQEAQVSAEARQRVGRDGFDVAGLAGAVLSPVNKLLSVSPAATALQRIGQNVATGAIYGALQPDLEDDGVSEKLFQIGLGAIFSGGFSAVSETTPILKKLVKELPLTKKNKEEIFKNYIKDLTPDSKKELVDALKREGELVVGSAPTAGEMLADTPSAYKILKAQERLEKGQATAGKFLERRATQQKARINALDEVFGSPADLELAKQARITSTTPMRERALREADFYGDTASKLEQELAKGTKQFGALAPKQRADILKGQIENIKANGYYPLASKSLIDKIDTMANTPGLRSNDMLNYAMVKLRGKLDKLTDERGVINSADLYNVRKEISEDLAEYVGSKNLNNASFRAQATGAETSLKKLIDTEINNASGSNLWSDYLSKFAEHSRKIDQLELGQALKGKLEGTYSEETAGKFLQAIKEAPTTIKRSTGQARYQDLGEVLDNKQLATVNKVYADVLRQEKAVIASRGIEGAKAAEVAVAQEVPGFISAKVTFVKNVLRDLAKGSQKEFDNRMTEMLLNPQKFADFLETVPDRNQDEVMKALAKRMSPTVREQFNISYGQLPTRQEVIRATSQDTFE